MHGIGAKKSAEYGADLLREIADFCQRNGIAMDVDPAALNTR